MPETIKPTSGELNLAERLESLSEEEKQVLIKLVRLESFITNYLRSEKDEEKREAVKRGLYFELASTAEGPTSTIRWINGTFFHDSKPVTIMEIPKILKDFEIKPNDFFSCFPSSYRSASYHYDLFESEVAKEEMEVLGEFRNGAVKERSRCISREEFETLFPRLQESYERVIQVLLSQAEGNVDKHPDLSYEYSRKAGRLAREAGLSINSERTNEIERRYHELRVENELRIAKDKIAQGWPPLEVMAHVDAASKSADFLRKEIPLSDFKECAAQALEDGLKLLKENITSYLKNPSFLKVLYNEDYEEKAWNNFKFWSERLSRYAKIAGKDVGAEFEKLAADLDRAIKRTKAPFWKRHFI